MKLKEIFKAKKRAKPKTPAKAGSKAKPNKKKKNASQGAFFLKIPSLKKILSCGSWVTSIAFFAIGALASMLLLDYLVTKYLEGSVKKVPLDSGARVLREKSYVKDRVDYDMIVQKNVFCPGCPVPDMKLRILEEPKSCLDDAEKMPGSVKLIGTIVLSNPKFSVATLQDGASETITLKYGENFSNYGKVFEVRRNRVCFENGNGELVYVNLPEVESLSLPVARSGSRASTIGRAMPKIDGVDAVSDTEFEIKKNFLLKKLDDPRLLQQAKADPYRVNGETVGFKISQVVPGSVYESLGIRNGDVITDANGSPMNSIAKAQELYSDIRTTNNASITVLRNGNPITLNYNVGN